MLKVESGGQPREGLPPVEVPLGGVEETTQKVARKALSDQIHFTWRYTGKGLMLTRHVLNLIARSCRYIIDDCSKLDAKIALVVLKLKVFSVVSIPLNLRPTRQVYGKLLGQYQEADFEGVALSGVSLGLLAADTFDSLITFVNSTLQLTGNAPVQWMSSLSLPLALGLLTTGIGSRGYKVYAAQRLKGDIEQMQKLGKVEAEHFDRLSRDLLKRHSSEKVKGIVKRLYMLLTEPFSGDPSKLVDSVICQLNQLKAVLDGQMKQHFVAMAASALALLGIALFFTAAPPFLPFFVLGCATITRIASAAYEDLGYFDQIPTCS